MRKLFLVAGMMAVTALVVPAFGADGKKRDKDTKKDDKYAATPQDYAALNHMAELTGTLNSVDATGKSFTLRIDFPTLVLKDNAGQINAKMQRLANEQAHLLNEQAQIMRIRNPIQRQQRMQNLLGQMQRLQTQAGGESPYKVVMQHKDFDLQGTDDIQVRLQTPPLAFDDKGFPKKYTPDELKEMKGKGPGYAGTWDDLKTGMIVKVTFQKKKKDDKDAKKDDKDKDAAKKDDKDKDQPKDPVDNTQPPLVTMIYVIVDPNANPNQSASSTDKK